MSSVCVHCQNTAKYPNVIDYFGKTLHRDCLQEFKELNNDKEKTIIKSYLGNKGEAEELFSQDSERFLAKNYKVVSERWEEGRWSGGAFLVALLLSFLLIGILVFIYMVIVKPKGSLIVTYKLDEAIQAKEPSQVKRPKYDKGKVSEPLAVSYESMEPSQFEEDSLSPEQDTKECPQCAETIKFKAKICRFCRHKFEE